MLVFGCVAEPGADIPSPEVREIVDNLEQAGFPAGDIMVVNGKVYVGRDAEVSLAASREMLQTGDSSEEQYRTNNLVSTSLTKICIDGSTFTGVFSTALDYAIQNYNELPLSFALARTPSSGCSFTINAVFLPGVIGGLSGYPSGGLPYSTIKIGDGLASFSVDTIEHVITHEIGHTIGFRHSDYYDRRISCGTDDDPNEGDGGVGAIHIPGTPTSAAVGGSIMNSCFRPVESGEFTGADVTALRALYPGTQVCTGQTTPGATDWRQHNAHGLYLDVNTSACGYTAVPRYTTSLGGQSQHWRTTGATSIYLPTATGFRVYVFDDAGPVTPADANSRGWHINWQATPANLRRPEACTGGTLPGATSWQQYGAQGLYLDVNTSACGYTAVPRYTTSLGGHGYHWRTMGATSIYLPTATGFRVYVFDDTGPVTPADANSKGWHINWQATPDNLRRPEACTGGTLPGATSWQQYGAQGLYLDVNTSACGYTAVPRYTTSLGGQSRHWRTMGATSIYLPTATGFRVYVFDDAGPVTPVDADNRGWYINWQARPR
jgi:hypothetical protein